jgi:hypothetical protein
MRIIPKQRLRDGVILAIALWAWPATGWAYTQNQEQACTNDAFRLCGPEIPDVNRVTACMVRRQAELSPGCRVYFRHESTVSASHGRPHKARKRAHSGR